MKLSEKQLEKLMGLESIQAVKSVLDAEGLLPSLPQAKILRKHLEKTGEPAVPAKLAIIHTYTSELLDPWLDFYGALNGLKLDTYHAPYGVTIQETAPESGLRRHEPDLTLMLVRREDFHPAMSGPIAGIPQSERPAVSDELVDAMCSQVQQIRESVGGHVLMSILPDMLDAGLGLYDVMAEQSEAFWWSDIKRRLAQKFREDLSGVSLLDLDAVVIRIGRSRFFDKRLWYSSQFPFAPEGAQALSDAVTSIAASQILRPAKVIVLDADNTLWGGVIGEDGLSGISLGQEWPGRAYVDFQKRILALQQRGFILALCSKNNPQDVEEVFKKHPHQLLKNHHFAAQRVNWRSKPDNLRSIAEELNLGLESFIFVDDSDHECAAVRQSMSDVTVVQVPKNPMHIPSCLDSVARLQINSLTEEDLQKTAMYAQESMRKTELQAAQSSGSSIQEYLKSLDMRMAVVQDEPSALPRLAQLTQKTNQFNLTTRRYSEQDIAERIEDPAWRVFHFSLSDKFGDSGIVGLAMTFRESQVSARLDTFLMSCRVIGRTAEQAFLHHIAAALFSDGIENLIAEYLPTAKNVLVENFLPENGFVAVGEGQFELELGSYISDVPKELPVKIEVQTSE